MRRRNERASTKISKKLLAIIISLLITAIQVAVVYYGFFSITRYQWVYFTLQGIGIFIVLVIYRNVRDSSSYKLTWTIIILAVPVLGTCLYLFVKNSHSLPKFKQRRIEQNLFMNVESNFIETKVQDDISKKLISSIQNDTKYNVYNNSKVIFYPDAKDQFIQMFADLRNAKKFIFLEYFIIAKGILLDELIDILEQKGREGVEINFIFDDVGSVGSFKLKAKSRLKKIPNLTIVPFAPLGLNLNPIVNYRDHRKICIIDGLISYVGGANIADEYVHHIKRFGHWRDNGIRIEGEATNNFLRLFIETWYMSTSEVLEYKEYKLDKVEEETGNYILPFGSGPMNINSTSYNLFFALICNATKYLYISTPYFIIDDMMIKALVMACNMGVDVKILIPGIPDKKSAYLLSQAHFGEILHAGGKVYKYSKGFNHAKNILIDDRYGFCGTVNIDYRSMFLHYECGALIIDDPCLLDMKLDFEKAIEESEIVSYTSWKKRNLFSRLFAFIFRVFSPLF